MARGQISDEDLSSGLKGLSGFGSLGGKRVVKDSPFRDSRSEPKVVEVGKPAERAVVAKKASEPERPGTVELKPAPVKGSQKAVPVKKAVLEPKAAAPGRRVADIYTERVTLQLSPEIRDRVDALAKELQRSKAIKGERITANTVMRVAIRKLLDEFAVPQAESINSEDELLVHVLRSKE